VKAVYLLAILALGCASTTASSAPASDGSEIDPNAGQNLPPPEGPAEKCLDSENQPAKCDSDQDCCEGFYCGMDPEGSTRIKTCVYGGGSK
jgi:hypothetical protein